MSKNWLLLSVLALMLAMTSVVSHAEGAEDGKDTDRKTESKEGEDAAADPYSLYKKVGRTWMHKSVTKISGMDDMVSYMKYEITAVADDHAIYVMTMLDAAKRRIAHLPPMETKVEFVVHDRWDGPEDEAPEPKLETVKVEAGEFKCNLYEHGETNTWISVKYPGLLVKLESENTTMELVEFKDSDRKTESKDPEGKEKDSDKETEKVDPYWLYKKVGRTWMHKTTVKMQGMDDLIFYMKLEITTVKDDYAIMTTTTLDAEMKPSELNPPTETKIEFDVPEPSDDAEEAPKQETVKVEAGEFKCYVTERDGMKMWTSIKYPGLLVKMESENTEIELLEFKE